MARNGSIRISERIVVWLPKGWCLTAVDTTDRKPKLSRLPTVRDRILEILYDNCPGPESSDWINYLRKANLMNELARNASRKIELE